MVMVIFSYFLVKSCNGDGDLLIFPIHTKNSFGKGHLTTFIYNWDSINFFVSEMKAIFPFCHNGNNYLEFLNRICGVMVGMLVS